jgi:hypothetical protein
MILIINSVFYKGDAYKDGNHSFLSNPYFRHPALRAICINQTIWIWLYW